MMLDIAANPLRLTDEDVARLARDAVSVRIGKRNPEIVLLCEHGGNQIPAPWNSLGLHDVFRQTHFGHDIGAGDLTLQIAERLGATAIVSNYSRLFLDYNRKTHDPSCIRPDMGGIPVPGNQRIGKAERQLRERIARHPVEAAVAAELEGTAPRGKGIISIHSFSPVWETAYRSCEIGVMWREDPRLPIPLIGSLRTQNEVSVEENQPYSFAESDWFTLDRHGLSVDVPNAYIEIRNDLLASNEAINRMADLLSTGIAEAFKPFTTDRNPA